MTPYWPSPLGATHRRLSPKHEVQTFLFSTESFRSQAPTTRRFPKPNRGLKWIADADQLPSPRLGLDPDRPAPEAG